MTPLWRRILAVSFAVVPATAAPAAGQGFTFVTPDSSAGITLGGRVQTIFNTTSVDDEPATATELRRVRLEATVQLNRVVGGKIQPEFAGSRFSLKDAYVRLSLDPALEVWAGQANRPFGVITPMSSTRILPIERGVRIRGVDDAFDQHNLISELGYAERDVGIQLRGEPAGAPLGLSYAAGVFNGPARARAPEENTYQVVARVAARPAGWARVGVSYSRIDFANVVDDVAAVETSEGDAWAADVELGSGRGGLHVVGEVTTGDFDPFTDGRFFGAQGWVGYRTGRASSTITALEPFLRVSHGDPDVDDEILLDGTGGTLITPGINLWLGGLNRFAVNYEIWNPASGETVRSFKAMFQMAF
ncbi:MAG: OprO/OprP family phosphate-selective porin [Gemmatimonadetes bacterium]|nr:OprO/OprP family phosphate-selective porin [Gemmatimonadota bacterium]